MINKLIIVIALVFTTNTATATAVTKEDVGIQATTTVQRQKLTPDGVVEVKMAIYHYSQKYGVEIEKLTYIVENESHYKTDAIGDMNLTCKRTGQPVRARGILQITECWYPEISDECAFDIYCSMDKMILLIKDDNTCKSQWTTCRNYLR